MPPFMCCAKQAVVAANKARRGGGTGSVRDENIGVVASLGVAALAAAGNQLITTPAQGERLGTLNGLVPYARRDMAWDSCV